MNEDDVQPGFKDSLVFMWKAYNRFRFNLQPVRALYQLNALTITLAVASNTVMIWLIGKPFTLLHEAKYDAVYEVLFWIVVVIVFNQINQIGGAHLSRWVNLQFAGRTRSALFNRVLSMAYPAAHRYTKGDIMTRLTTDVDTICDLVIDTPLALLSHLLTFSIYIGMMFWIDVRMAAIAVCITPVFLLHQHYFSPRAQRLAAKAIKKHVELNSFEEQNLGNLRGINTNTAESVVSRLHKAAFENMRYWYWKEAQLRIWFGQTFTIIIYLVGLIIILLGIDAVRSDIVDIGLLISFLLYLGYLTVPISGFTNIAINIRSSVPSVNRYMSLHDEEGVTKEKENASGLHVTQGNINISNLVFSYPDSANIFSGVDLDIKAGETVALVGPSGVGKSTLAILLLRFYDPIEGSISIDGVDIRDVTLFSLRNNMAVVWQEPFLINGTIRANLNLVKDGATEEEMIAACKAGYAWEFIEPLANGLDTHLGSQGIELSAGQKQRLTISQAFLRDAPILVLDEATSALDSHAEKMLVGAIDKLRAGRTTLMIAHRYSSIRNADRIIYFNRNGTVIMSTHEELLEQQADYRDAVEWQTGQKE